jgi:glycopeptide antibiotics resistance protein
VSDRQPRYMAIYHEVPALPVVVAVIVLGFTGAVAWLHGRAAATGPRILVAAVASIYAAGVVSAVFLPFPIRLGAAREGVASWHSVLHLTPLIEADPTGLKLNVLLFVPLGLLLPLVARVATAGRALLIGCVLSVGIEATQFVTDLTISSGRVADIDDVISNSVGALLGYGLYRLAVSVPRVAQAAAAATWPGPKAVPSPPWPPLTTPPVAASSGSPNRRP